MMIRLKELSWNEDQCVRVWLGDLMEGCLLLVMMMVHLHFGLSKMVTVSFYSLAGHLGLRYALRMKAD